MANKWEWTTKKEEKPQKYHWYLTLTPDKKDFTVGFAHIVATVSGKSAETYATVNVRRLANLQAGEPQDSIISTLLTLVIKPEESLESYIDDIKREVEQAFNIKKTKEIA
jgi:hypothetical protein